MMKELIYETEEAQTGLTVERFLRWRGYSRALIVMLKNTECGFSVNGLRVFSNYRLSAGETLRVCICETETSDTIVPIPLPLSIVYEDEDMYILDKPAGMAVHPSPGNRESSLANALAALYAERGEPFVFRAIGRLDKNTSGLVLLAKHPLSACILSENAAVRREYLALCEGKIPQTGTISFPIGRAPNSAIRRQVRTDGDHAVTHFERLSYQNGISLAHIWLDTGRTHQIRVHMAHIGHPLVGDFLYNPQSTQISRHALHAFSLSLPHPLTGVNMSFTSALPADMENLLQK